jgi:hypothetical protein
MFFVDYLQIILYFAIIPIHDMYKWNPIAPYGVAMVLLVVFPPVVFLFAYALFLISLGAGVVVVSWV